MCMRRQKPSNAPAVTTHDPSRVHGGDAHRAAASDLDGAIAGTELDDATDEVAVEAKVDPWVDGTLAL